MLHSCIMMPPQLLNMCVLCIIHKTYNNHMNLKRLNLSLIYWIAFRIMCLYAVEQIINSIYVVHLHQRMFFEHLIFEINPYIHPSIHSFHLLTSEMYISMQFAIIYWIFASEWMIRSICACQLSDRLAQFFMCHSIISFHFYVI